MIKERCSICQRILDQVGEYEFNCKKHGTVWVSDPQEEKQFTHMRRKPRL